MPMSSSATALDQVFRWLAIALIFGATVLPYLGGFPLSYLLMVLIIALSIWQLTLARRRLAPIDPAALMFGAAFALLLVACAANARGMADLGIALNFFLLLLVYPLVQALGQFRRADASQWVATGALLGVLVAVGVAIYQRQTGLTRAEGYFSDSLWATAVVIALGFIALIGVRASRFPTNLAFLLGPVAAAVVTVLAGARGPLLALPPLLVVASVMLPRRRWVTPVLLVGGLALTGLIVAGLALLSPVTFDRLASLLQLSSDVARGAAPSEASAGIRWSLLTGAFEAFKASPWLGHGWGHFGEVVFPYVGAFDLARTPGQFHLHNDFADFAVAGGVLGILAYGLILAAPVVGAIASPRDTQRHGRLLGTVVLSLTYLVCGQTNVMFGFEFLTTLYVALTAIILGWCRDP